MNVKRVKMKLINESESRISESTKVKVENLSVQNRK